MSVGQSVGWSVGHSKCSCDLKYGLYQPASDWGSRVSGLVFFLCNLYLETSTVIGFEKTWRAGKVKYSPQDSNPSLEAQIPASRLKFQPQGSNLHTGTDERMKVPLCSKGYSPLWDRCPATDHLQSPIYIAGQRVSLTTYCPRATG